MSSPLIKNVLNDIQSPHIHKITHEKKLVIFGLGQFAKDCAKALKKSGFDVDGYLVTNKSVSSFNGINVFSLGEFIDNDVQVIVGVFNREHPYSSIMASLEDYGYLDVLFPWDIYGLLAADLGWRYWLSEPGFLYDNLDKISDLLTKLGDDLSRSTIINVLKFRMGLDLDYSLHKSDDEQYFNALTLEPLKGEAVDYVDGGAFDGDSYLELLKHVELNTAYLFEPDRSNFEQLKNNVAGVATKCAFIPLALSNEYKILSFSGDGEGAHIDASGAIKIAAAALDDVIHEAKVNFLKLDVEGSESEALIGAEGIIKKYRPVMALSAYHRPDDLWKLPNIISSIADDYTFYFRQHFYNSFDIVLYAVPYATSR